MNLVKYQQEHVNEAQREFESVFERSEMDKKDAIRQIEEKYKEILKL